MENKQTAVEWFWSKIALRLSIEQVNEFIPEFQQAKQMEKEQIDLLNECEIQLQYLNEKFGESQTDVRCSFLQGDKIKIETEDFGTIYGEFHRYGQSRFGAIIFVNGEMRFVDEQSLNNA